MVFWGRMGGKIHHNEYYDRISGRYEGQVIIDGHDILKEPEAAKKQIGYLPEQPPLYMEMTVREYLQFAAELKRIPGKNREEAVDEVEKLVKVRSVEDRLIRNLSKGYRQRVGLARQCWDSRILLYWMNLQ